MRRMEPPLRFENRPHGWNTWVTFTISPPTPTPAHRRGG